MAKYSILNTFYASDAWRNLRATVIAERGLTCEYCGERVAKAAELTLHHIIELTPDNVHDAMVALNPENIMVVHHACHNTIHKHAAHKAERGVYIVYGAPLSGKKTFVKDRMWTGDLVVDMDALYHATTMLPWYDKPNGLLYNVKSVYNLLLDHIKTRYGRWDRAWIIGGYHDKYKREKLAEDLGAELVHIKATKEECLERLKVDEGRMANAAEWKKYIDDWFDRFVE